MRAAARRDEWRGSTGGQCPTYQQANLVILPKEAAVEFAAFCTRNPKPGPLIEITPPSDPEPARAADLGRPDYGDPVAIHPNEVPVFWASGVTPQAVALEARPKLMIAHEPGIMCLTDLPREGDTA